MKNYPDLSSVAGSRIIDGNHHKPKKEPRVAAFASALRRIQPALEEQVCNKLDVMASDGLFEKIESSPWATNMEVAPNPEGDSID